MKPDKQNPSLYQPVTYQISVPGVLDEKWSDWHGSMTITIERHENGQPITVFTGCVDQAALQGLLRRLYGLGFPLISVICLDCV
jgi:hypothetical protein